MATADDKSLEIDTLSQNRLNATNNLKFLQNF